MNILRALYEYHLHCTSAYFQYFEKKSDQLILPFIEVVNELVQFVIIFILNDESLKKIMRAASASR